MPFPSRAALLAVLVGVLASAPALPVSAAETSNAEFVIVQEDDVFPADLYAAAIRVVVDGTLEGDLIAFAAEEVVINGTVTGSVIAASPRVTVSGTVGQSLRVVANSLSVTGTVRGDLVGAVWAGRLEAGSEVEGDVLAWAWDADALGTIGADLTGSQRSLDLGGRVEGDVDVSVGRLRIPTALVVGGDLGFRSSRPALGLENAETRGAVVDKEPLPPNLRVRALGLLGRFLVVLFLALSALTVAYGWPGRTRSAVDRLRSTPVRSWVKGAVVLFSPLLAVLFAALLVGLAPAAAAFPLLIVLVPVILALVGLAFAMTLVAGAPTVAWLGAALFRRLDLYGSVLVGSVIVGILWWVPWVGWVVPLVALPLGLGALMGSWGQPSVAELQVNPSKSSARSGP